MQNDYVLSCMTMLPFSQRHTVCPCLRCCSARAGLRAALARLEGEQLRDADFPGHRSLEALQLEDPASMSGCWNPGYAAESALAHDALSMHTPVGAYAQTCACAACWYAVSPSCILYLLIRGKW